MQKLSNFSWLTHISAFLILLALAKVISLSIWWFLPSDGIELEKRENYKPAYQRVDFKSMLVSPSKNKPKVKQKNPNTKVSITNMLLKGLYGKGTNGMAIVAMKSSPTKTTVVSVGEVFATYTLKTILQRSVVFSKNSKDYTLHMGKSKEIKKSTISVIPIEQTTTTVQRADINDYISNRKDIWKDIAINAIKDENGIKGFKVNRIKKNSSIGSLGLKKDDVIVAANNVELKSYRDVLQIYKKIKELKSVQLIVLRNNQEVELVYEIN